MKELRMKKYKYNINNLDCANCARKIEEILNKNKELKNAIVNFNTSKISYEAEREFSIKELWFAGWAGPGGI